MITLVLGYDVCEIKILGEIISLPAIMPDNPVMFSDVVLSQRVTYLVGIIESQNWENRHWIERERSHNGN